MSSRAPCISCSIISGLLSLLYLPFPRFISPRGVPNALSPIALFTWFSASSSRLSTSWKSPPCSKILSSISQSFRPSLHSSLNSFLWIISYSFFDFSTFFRKRPKQFSHRVVFFNLRYIIPRNAENVFNLPNSLFCINYRNTYPKIANDWGTSTSCSPSRAWCILFTAETCTSVSRGTSTSPPLLVSRSPPHRLSIPLKMRCVSLLLNPLLLQTVHPEPILDLLNPGRLLPKSPIPPCVPPY